MLEFNVPGMPEEARAMVQAQMAESDADVTTSCLTAEQAANSQEEVAFNPEHGVRASWDGSA